MPHQSVLTLSWTQSSDFVERVPVISFKTVPPFAHVCMYVCIHVLKGFIPNLKVAAEIGLDELS